MVLHFNLKGMFFLCCGLIFWQIFLPYPLLGGVLGVAAVFGWMRRDFSAADAVFAVAFLLNLWYVAASMGNVRQYDYYNFVMQVGYFISNDFFVQNPAGFLQEIYFQPPLWGLISAVVTKLCMALGETQAAGFDCVRFINLFAVSGAGIVFWRFTGLLSFKPEVRFGVFALFCLFPANAIFANLVNNDAMVYFLMLVMLYAGYLWNLAGGWKETFVLAGMLFLAGMIKFSGIMIVPALGVFGLCRLVQAEDKLSLRLWGQFGVIGLGAVLGFGWGWFLLYYGLPLVPPPLNTEFQNLSNYTVMERLFSLETIGYPLADVRAGKLEANVFLALLKTALFGEWAWRGMFWAYVLYAWGGILAVLLAASFFSLWKYKMGRDYALNLAVVMLVFSVFGAWANFWLEYPYFCSSEFRYAAILLPVSLLWFGNYLSQKSLPKAVSYALAGGLVLFVAARIMLYLHTI